MKTNITYVDASLFEAIIVESGLQHTAQKGFMKVQGPKGRAVYVASTKRVGRVDISGFEVDFGVVPHCGPFGNVKQQLNFAQDQEAILNDFKALLETLKVLEPIERKPRAISSTKKSEEPKGWTAIDVKARRELIEKVAAEKGTEVSPRAFANEA